MIIKSIKEAAGSVNILVGKCNNTNLRQTVKTKQKIICSK